MRKECAPGILFLHPPSMCKNHKTSCAQTMKPQYIDNIEKVTDLCKGMIHGGILQ